MVSLPRLCQFLDQLLAPALVQDSCPNGLQVEGKKEVTTVAFAVSATAAVIERAASLGADALVVHHGIFWGGAPQPLVGSLGRRAALLLEKKISLLAYHLPLDLHPEVGNNWGAAKEMGWSDLEPFCTAGRTKIGVKGIAALPVEQFRKQLESYYQHSATHIPGKRALIERVALVSGGAYKTIEEAAKEGVDAFVTGSFDEPVWSLAQELNIHFFALGHHATERVGPRLLQAHLERAAAEDALGRRG